MAWATKLVGRGPELAELRRELQHAAAGEFRVVLLLADPGIGKTRLAREFLARSQARVVGLSARAYPLGETASFGVWSEALESHLRGLPPTRSWGSAAAFSMISPPCSPAAPPPPPPPAGVPPPHP